MKTEKDLKTEARRIRERARELSGFWISELAAAAYALEWVTGRRPAPPSAAIGAAEGDFGKIAESLAKAASEAAQVAKPTPAARAAPRSRATPAGGSRKPRKS
jgi:hypothetical protein